MSAAQKSHDSRDSKDSKIPAPSALQDPLMAAISGIIAPLGYEVIHLEIIHARQKTLRLFIDFLDKPGGNAARSIGIEDCVTVNRALDEPLERMPEIAEVFSGPYELEVSSPGIDRPLRRPQDFERFKGHDIQAHVFRPLTAEETGNAAYCARNPKQKNFQGELRGLEGQSIRLGIRADGSSRGGKEGLKKKRSPRSADACEQADADQIPAEEVLIPLALIAKASLKESLKESMPHVHEPH